MTGRHVYRGLVRAGVAGALLAASVWGLTGDLQAEAHGAVAAAAAPVPAAALVTPSPAAVTVDDVPVVLEERSTPNGRVLVDPRPQSSATDTSANVIAWPAAAPGRPDGAALSFSESPLPVPDGAAVTRSVLEGAALTTEATGGTLGLEELTDFYRDAFGPNVTVTERTGRDGTVRLVLSTAEGASGWVLLDPEGGTVGITIVWYG